MPLIMLNRLHACSITILLTLAVCRFCLLPGVMASHPFSLRTELLPRRCVLCDDVVGAVACLVLDARINLMPWLCSPALTDVLGA